MEMTLTPKVQFPERPFTQNSHLLVSFQFPYRAGRIDAGSESVGSQMRHDCTFLLLLNFLLVVRVLVRVSGTSGHDEFTRSGLVWFVAVVEVGHCGVVAVA